MWHCVSFRCIICYSDAFTCLNTVVIVAVFIILHNYANCVTSVVSDSVWPHRQQPTRLPRPWDSPGKNTGVGCHFPLQCMKVKSESEVAQSCWTPSDPMDCSLPGSSIGFSRQEYCSGLPSPSPQGSLGVCKLKLCCSTPSLRHFRLTKHFFLLQLSALVKAFSNH